MMVAVNGRGTEVPEGTTAERIVEIMGLDPSRVAVEIDGEICPRTMRDQVVLLPGQSIELVSFVGGG